MSDVFDALIVGGGPAGIAAGIALARQGVRTALCERRSIPVEKVCGQGIMPTGVADLKRLGVAQYLTADHAYSFLGIRYRSPNGAIATAPFAEGSGLGIRRTVLSTALWRRAQTIEGLELYPETSAAPVARDTDGITVALHKRRVKTRLLIGADGLNSRIRRWAGLDGPTGRLRRWGVRQHFNMKPWSDYVEVHWGKGIEAYITPCGPSLVEIAFLWDRARCTGLPGGKALFPALLEAFPHLEARLSGKEAVDEAGAVGPLHRTAKAPAGDGVLLIGDAAGYLDAITGEGVSLATAQALALTDTVVPLLQRAKASPRASDLAPYTAAYKRISRPCYALTYLALWLSRHPALTEYIIRSFAKRPALFQTMLSVNMGHIPSWRATMGAIARLARGMV